MLKRLIVHSSHYTVGSLLVTLASIVSFPIFTRTFSVADYGTLNLIASLLLFWTGIGKLGVQQSIARYQGEVSTGHRPLSERAFSSTVLVGMSLTGLAATLGWLLMSLVIPASWWRDDHVSALLLPLSGLVLVRVLDSAVSNLLRAQQRSVLFNVYVVLRKYLALALILVLILGVMPGLRGFYAGTFAVESVAVLVLAAWLLRQKEPGGKRFDPATFKSMLWFGAPLIAMELSGIVLNLGDRYVLQAMLGPEAVGHYSAAYNFSDYVRVVVFTSFAQAITPLYVRTWEESGEKATAEFVERSLRVYLMVAAAVVAGMTAVGGSFLTMLASDKYAPAAAVIPFVILAMCIDGGTPFFSAGMYIHKKNKMIVPYVVAAAVANIGLNIMLIPHLGILGAGVSTLACYVMLTIASWRIGSRYMRIRFPFADLAKYSAMAAVMYFVVMQVSLPVRMLDIAAKVACGVAVYSALVLAFDRPVRDWLAGFLAARHKARVASGGAP